MKAFLIRGVPTTMQRDGWWMNHRQVLRPAPNVQVGAAPHLWHLALLGALIALGDVLVWQVAPGLSLAVFGAAIMTGAICVAGRRVSNRQL